MARPSATGRAPIVIVGAGTSCPSVDIEREVLAEVNATIVDARELSDLEVAEHARGADAILTDYFACDAELIAAMEHCRVIASYGVGYDQVDVAAADAHGILVTNNPEYCVDEVAEHAIAMLMSQWRRLAEYDKHVREGGWDYTVVSAPRRLAGATLGIIGFGRIGRAVAALATGLGMNVLAYDPFLAPNTSTSRSGQQLVELEHLLRASDAITLHLPLTDQSRGLLSAERLALLQPHAGVINTARGALVDERALADALAAGGTGARGIAWAALDAFVTEPPPADHPLLSSSHTLVSPHAGFYSSQSLNAAQENAAREVLAVLEGRPPQHPVGQVKGTP
jgi:D-3-phosphoglycerate dehydrogenase